MAVLEMALLLALALLVDAVFLDATRFWGWSPHPFWIVVLLMSAQYGTREGLMTAIAASLALLVGNIPTQGVSQDLHTYVFAIARHPLLWCTTSIALGALRDRHRSERDRLTANLEEARFREKKVAGAYEQLSRLKSQLESQLVGQMRTSTTLYKAASSIEEMRPEAVLRGIVDVLRATLNPEQFSLYLLRGDQLELAIESGWKTSDAYSRCFPEATPLFREVVGKQTLLSINNPEHEVILGSTGVLAGPVVHPVTGEVTGMLKIERIDFADLNLSMLQTFKVVCEWIATLYRNAQKYETARSQSMVSEQTDLLSFGFFMGHKDFFVSLAQRMGFELSLLTVHLDNHDELTADELKCISKALKHAVAKVLRKTDLAFDQERTGRDFAIILTGTSERDAQFVASKLSFHLRSALGSLDSTVDFRFEAKSLHRSNRTHRLLSREFFDARLDFLFRLRARSDFDIYHATFELVNVDTLGDENRAQALQSFRSLVAEHLHQTEDLFFAYQRSETVLTVIMPGASLKESRAWAQKFKRVFKQEAGPTGAIVKYAMRAAPAPPDLKGKNAQQFWRKAKRLFAVPE